MGSDFGNASSVRETGSAGAVTGVCKRFRIKGSVLSGFKKGRLKTKLSLRGKTSKINHYARLLRSKTKHVLSRNKIPSPGLVLR